MDTIIIFTSSLLFLLFFIKLFISNYQKKKKQRENLPPSPPSIPFFGHLHLLHKPLHQSLSSIASLHGPLLLLRFGSRPVLLVSSATLADECFTTNDLAFANRPKFPSYRTASYNYNNMPFASYGPRWREMRRVTTAEVLSGNCLSFFSDIRATEVRALARRLYLDTTTSPDGDFKTVELRSRLFGLTMNVIMMMVVGNRYYVEESEERESRRFMEMVEEIFALVGVSNVGDFLPFPIGWIARIGVKQKFGQVHNCRDRLIQSLINELRKKTRAEGEKEAGHSTMHGKRNSKNLLKSLLSLQKIHPEMYTDVFIKSFIWSLLTAGIDATSNTLEWAISLLFNNPEKLEKLKHEIDDKVGSDRLLEESDLPKLPYLNNVINETLRMYPVAPLLLPHESMKECKVGGYTIPSGTIILVNAYVIQRDPETWSEPTKFLPERFTKDFKLERGKIFSFGMGRRSCPGEALAARTMGLALGTLVQCFEWRRIDSENVDMKEGSGLTMPREYPFQALCRPYESMIPMLNLL